MLIEVDKDVYDDIKEQYNCGIDKQWDDNWEMHYYVDDAILDLYESNCLTICEEWQIAKKQKSKDIRCSSTSLPTNILFG